MASQINYAEVGAWVTATYKVFRQYDLNDAAFEPYEATILAAKAGLLLSPLRRLGQVEKARFDVFRTLSGLKPRESMEVIKHLIKLDAWKVSWDPAGGMDSPVNSVTILATAKLDVLKAIGQLFYELNPSAVALASLASLSGTLQLPITQDALIATLVGSGLAEPVVKRAVEHLVSLGLLARTKERESGSPLLFNPMVFKKNVEDVYATVNGLNATKRQQALEILEWVRQQPGVPIPQNYDAGLIQLLIKCGLIDMSAIKAQGGAVQQEFPTIPALWAAQSVADLGGDIVDDAKTLLNSLRFGQIFSQASRGRIIDPHVLVGALIDRGSVGPCTAIGQDYPLPLARGIVDVVESRTKPGQFYMQLRKADVAEAVLDVFKHKIIVPEPVKADAIAQQLSKQKGQFISPEAVRIQKPLPPNLEEERDSLAFELRTYRKGR